MRADSHGTGRHRQGSDETRKRRQGTELWAAVFIMGLWRDREGAISDLEGNPRETSIPRPRERSSGRKPE